MCMRYVCGCMYVYVYVYVGVCVCVCVSYINSYTHTHLQYLQRSGEAAFMACACSVVWKHLSLQHSQRDVAVFVATDSPEVYVEIQQELLFYGTRRVCLVCLCAYVYAAIQQEHFSYGTRDVCVLCVYVHKCTLKFSRNVSLLWFKM